MRFNIINTIDGKNSFLPIFRQDFYTTIVISMNWAFVVPIIDKLKGGFDLNTIFILAMIPFILNETLGMLSKKTTFISSTVMLNYYDIFFGMVVLSILIFDVPPMLMVAFVIPYPLLMNLTVVKLNAKLSEIYGSKADPFFMSSTLSKSRGKLIGMFIGICITFLPNVTILDILKVYIILHVAGIIAKFRIVHMLKQFEENRK